jgi:hypothetical protein
LAFDFFDLPEHNDPYYVIVSYYSTLERGTMLPRVREINSLARINFAWDIDLKINLNHRRSKTGKSDK